MHSLYHKLTELLDRYLLPLVVAGFTVVIIGVGIACLESMPASSRAEAALPISEKPEASVDAAHLRQWPKKSDEVLKLEQWHRIARQLQLADGNREFEHAKLLLKLTSHLTWLTSDDRVDSYVDETLSLGSFWGALQDSGEHTQKLRELFCTYIWPDGEIERCVSWTADAISREMIEIDNDCLIEIQADVELDPGTLNAGVVNTAVVDEHIERLLHELDIQVTGSLARSVSSQFAGLAGFEAGRQVARNLAADENGDVSIYGEIASFGIGWLTNEFTQIIADDALEIRSAIEGELREGTNKIIGACDPGGVIYKELAEAPKRHSEAVFQAVTESLGIDPDWARANMPK